MGAVSFVVITEPEDKVIKLKVAPGLTRLVDPDESKLTFRPCNVTLSHIAEIDFLGM